MGTRDQAMKMAKGRRQFALDRPEFREPTVPRAPTSSPTSFPMKAEDPETRRLIDEALARRRT